MIFSRLINFLQNIRQVGVVLKEYESLEAITPKEIREILLLNASGYTTEGIARMYEIDPEKVKIIISENERTK